MTAPLPALHSTVPRRAVLPATPPWRLLLEQLTECFPLEDTNRGGGGGAEC